MKLQQSLKTTFSLLAFSLLIFSCSDDEPVQGGNNGDDGNDGSNGNPTTETCNDPKNYIFSEKDGFVKVEFENAVFPSEWKLETKNSASGKGYGVWVGKQSLGKPGNGLIEFKLDIKTSGVYRFLWNTAVTIGNNGTEHNDSWLKFPDASDFFGEKNGSRIYPKDTGKTPNPKGSSADGWFKIYRGGNDLDFKWQAATSDNDSHQVYVEFKTPGTYTMQVSARSEGHAIDQFILFQESKYSQKEAIEKTTFSDIKCQ